MRVLLTPRHHEAYGQDFLVRGMVESCGLTRLTPNNSGTYVMPNNVELIVSQNLDEKADAECIEKHSDTIPVVAHLHCQWGFFDDNQKAQIKRAINKVKIGIVPAEFLVHDIESVFPEIHWKTVRNGIDTHRFHPETEEMRISYKNSLGIGGGEILVGYVGRLENAKGLQLLEYIANNLHEINAHLLVQYLSTINNRAVANYNRHAERLKLVNPNRIHIVSDENPLSDRPVKYFDFLVHPSLSEVNPLVVLEAFISGVPVIATMCTPFYKELSSLEIPSACFSFIDLPERFNRDVFERSNLNLKENEITNVGTNLVKLLREKTVNTDCNREILHERSIAAGFSSEVMFCEFNKIYQQAINGNIP